jgi:hypothetical protein
MDKAIEPFEFKQCTTIVKSTGRKARDVIELREAIGEESEGCIYHHAYQYFLRGHLLEYTNDFAHWAGEKLEERALAERLSNIDPYRHTDIGSLRSELVTEIDEYLDECPRPRKAMPGDEFYFGEPLTLTYPVGIRARNLAEFLIAIKFIDPGTVYYHFFEARVRLGGGVDDFSKWLEDVLGRHELSERVSSIDIFMQNLEGTRELIAREVEEELRREMEEVLSD